MSHPGTDNPATRRSARISIFGLRRLILGVLTVSVLGFTGGVFVLVQRIFDDFGPATERDLHWKTARGALELASAIDLGLALGDPQLVTQSFGDFRRVEDVVAIVAVGADGRVIAIHGNPPENAGALFSGPAATVRTTPGYLVAWAAAVVEGNAVGKVAVVMSTRRLVESKSRLRRISLATAGSGVMALLFGFLFVSFFTRKIAQHDAQLAAHAAGLEGKVVERTAQLNRINRGMRFVFDNVDQGFLTVSLNGVISPERPRIVDRWFGAPKDGMTFSDYIRPVDGLVADWFDLGLQQLTEDLLPRDLLLDQLPRRVTHQGRVFSFAYSFIVAEADQVGDLLLVVITDMTGDIAREKAERESREMLGIFQHVVGDRAGAQQFLDEVSDLVQQVVVGSTLEIDRRGVHTIKGNCGLFGIESMVQICHEIESGLQDSRGAVTALDRERLRGQWEHVAHFARGLMVERQPLVELSEAELGELKQALNARAPHHEIAALAEHWRDEQVALRFARLATKTEYLAKRLGKHAIDVQIDTGGIRLPAERWAPFWAALVHAINNAVDHGIEAPEIRVARGKSPAGTLRLSAHRESDELLIALDDDGGGIDWTRLALVAAAKGLSHATEMDLTAALFSDGISTRAEVTASSGRGIGLGALRDATTALGGRIEVRSEPGRGASFVFRFPAAVPRTPRVTAPLEPARV